MSDEPVLLVVEDRIATITLNRPRSRNALDAATLRLLPRLVAQADADDAVDVLILTGADPAFCAGLDLKQLGSSGENFRVGEGADPTGSWRGPLPPTRKPLIGAVNGPAVTGGLELVLACDFLVASQRARFGDTHARVGVHPGWGLTVLLPEAVGLRRAREMSATGRLVDAVTALEWGLVNHVVAHDELLPFCRGLAADIRSADRDMLGRVFETYDAVADSASNGGWEAERTASRAWATSGGLRSDQVAARSDAIIRRGSDQL
jgi:enoyl-CoA hydratase/carnithine racemase